MSPSACAAAESETLPPGDSAPDDAGIVFGGRVVDRLTGEPVSGATVVARHRLSRGPVSGDWTMIEKTEHVTDGDGRWQVTIPAGQWEQPALYMEFETSRPGYEPLDRVVVSVSELRRNLREGQTPRFGLQKMTPADPVTGRLVNADGEPLPHATIRAWSIDENSRNRHVVRSQTDREGRFDLPIGRGRTAVICWSPRTAAPVQRLVPEDEHQLGEIVCEGGCVVSGRVVDPAGKPLPNLWVNVRFNGVRGSEMDMLLGKRALANLIVRSGRTDVDGRYVLNVLPPGEYTASVATENDEREYPETREDYSPEPLPELFTIQEVEIESDDDEVVCNIEAIPSLTVEGRFVDSAGNSVRGKQLAIQSEGDPYFGGFHYVESSLPDQDGRFRFLVPEGLEQPYIYLQPPDGRSARFQFGRNGSLRHGRKIYLYEITDEIETIWIVLYDAPSLYLNVVDEAGNRLSDVDIASEYATPAEADSDGEVFRYKTGDVLFRRQKDGRWRSSYLLPNEETTVRIEKEGYSARTLTLELREGETRAVDVVLSSPG